MNAKANRKPRPYQNACLKSLREARKAGKTKALVVMASGTGKTLTGIFDLKEYLKENPEGRVLVLCHSADVLRQIRDEYRAMFGYEYSYGMYNETEKTTRKTDFMFANLQSVNLHPEEFGPDEFVYVIVDEAHHAPAVTYRRAVEHFEPQFLLGMTATPDRTDDASLAEIFGDRVFTYDLVRAVNEGSLSGIDYRVKLDDMMKLETVLDSDEQISMSRLNREFFVPKRDEEIVRLIREGIAEKNDPTMVIFCQTIDHAEHIAELMGDAIVIHSKLDDDTIVERLADFRSGKARTVCAVNMLNEGIDIPRTDVIVFLRVTQSRIIFTQQLGRGLRLAEGKDKVLVLDFVATADRLVQIFELMRKFKDYTGTYTGKPGGTHEYFTLNIDTSGFRERTVDIISLIEQAQIRRDYTNEEMLERLRDKARELGRSPHVKDLQDDENMPTFHMYRRCFGSFNKALILAGLRPFLWKDVSNEELLDLLRMKAQELGRTPMYREVQDDPDMPTPSVYEKRFGNFRNVIKRAGLKIIDWHGASNEELLELLRKKAKELGRAPTYDDVEKDPDMPSPQTYKKRFKGFHEAIVAAGLTPIVYTKWAILSKEELLELLRQKAKKLGKAPTTRDLKEDPNMPDVSVYVKNFGSFTNALERAGLKPNSPRRWAKMSNEELLDLLRKKAQELSRTPMEKDLIADPNMPTIRTYADRFGGFVEALRRAGLELNIHQEAHSRSSKKGGKEAPG